jgi:hypothetical protein
MGILLIGGDGEDGKGGCCEKVKVRVLAKRKILVTKISRMGDWLLDFGRRGMVIR